ncbi:MAG: M50 family metallopeptidase [Trueperaceae bacterium]
MLTALTFALILTSAVTVHELAHYLNARSVGVPVRAFSVGVGPIIARRMWRGTEWRLSLLPLGGYVDLPGMAPKVDEDGELQHPDEGMALVPWHQKIWVLVGGVIANYLLGSVLLASAISMQPAYMGMLTGSDAHIQGSVVAGVMQGSRAEALGLAANDRIVMLNGVANPTPEEVIAQVRGANALEITVEGDAGRRTVSTPWPPEGAEAVLGIEIGTLVEPVGFFEVLPQAAAFGIRVVPQMVSGFVSGIGSAVTGAPNQDVAGPVGMVTMVAQATQIGLAPVLLLAAVINLSLGVFNLLPIPGLDGGRMLLATIVAVRGKPFKPGQEEQIHFIGVMLVMALIVLITFREVGALFTG